MGGVRGLITLLFVSVCLFSACKSEISVPPPKPIDPANAVPVDAPVELQGLSMPLPRGPEFRRGIALGLFVSTDDPPARREYYAQFLDEIRDVGATDISLVVRWAQQDINASSIAPDPTITVDDAVLSEVVDMAHARGLRIFLLPILHLNVRGKGKWRGTLRPSDEEAWWSAYTRFIHHYADLSESKGIEMLAVGSELSTMESRHERWRALIKTVRGRYKGRLTYSANWDHFEPIRFWDALDVVGVTAYQELSKRRYPTEAQLDKGWGPFQIRLKQWARQHGRRYIFTEVGFPSNPHGAARPWDHRERGEPRPELQLKCFRSMFRIWHDDPRLDGLFIWNWFGHGGPRDLGYTPRGKPSSKVIEHWFSLRSSKGLNPTPDLD